MFFTPGTHTIQRNRTHIYHTFIPNSLNGRILIKSDEELTMLLSKAHRFLGVLEGTARWIKNIDAIETAFMAKEAFLSCKIEDSKATLEEMLYSTKKKNKHLQETQCYLETINKTMKIKDEAYSNLSLCSLYRMMMADEKNESDTCYRKIQIFDLPGVFITDMEMYNPTAPEYIETAMNDLERYVIKENSGPDVLVKIALFIYQFVTISPFEIENRIFSRLVFMFLLTNYKVLSRHILCYSDFIILDKTGFYDRLAAVRFAGDYNEWIKHFLKGIIFSAEKAINTINNLVALKDENLKRINDAGYSDINIFKLLEYMEQNPMTNIKTATQSIGLSYNTTAKMVNILLDIGIIRQGNQLSRNRCYVYQKYIDTVFGYEKK